jgi:hypothetical protein
LLLSEAAQLLQRLGYTTDEQLPVQSSLHSRLQRRAYHQCLFRSPANVSLELHWRLAVATELSIRMAAAHSGACNQSSNISIICV